MEEKKNKRGTGKELLRKEEEEEGRTSQKGRKALMTTATVEEGAYPLCIEGRQCIIECLYIRATTTTCQSGDS